MFSDLSGSIFLSVAFCSLVYNVITPSVRGGAANDTAPPQDVYPRYLCTADTLSNVRPSLFTFSIIRWCLPPTRSSILTCSPASISVSLPTYSPGGRGSYSSATHKDMLSLSVRSLALHLLHCINGRCQVMLGSFLPLKTPRSRRPRHRPYRRLSSAPSDRIQSARRGRGHRGPHPA